MSWPTLGELEGCFVVKGVATVVSKIAYQIYYTTTKSEKLFLSKHSGRKYGFCQTVGEKVARTYTGSARNITNRNIQLFTTSEAAIRVALQYRRSITAIHKRNDRAGNGCSDTSDSDMSDSEPSSDDEGDEGDGEWIDDDCDDDGNGEWTP